jgi:Methylamine utilisation protein MauE
VNPALGPFAIASVVLVVAGGRKLLEPRDTSGALRAMGLPGAEAAVRAGAAGEVALGIVALVATNAVIALLVAVSYASFFAFVAVARARRLPIASCGCLGKADTPPSRVHLGIDLGACVAAVGMAIDPSITPLDVVSDQRLAPSMAYVVLVAVGVVVSLAVLTRVPRVAAARPRP